MTTLLSLSVLIELKELCDVDVGHESAPLDERIATEFRPVFFIGEFVDALHSLICRHVFVVLQHPKEP